MSRFEKNEKGQFVIIAVLLVAIMIVSIGALLHDAASFYKHEPWQEYSTMIGNVELNSQRLLELSLTNYTQTGNLSVLRENLVKWQLDLLRLYPSTGITLDFTLASGPVSVCGVDLTFSEGLATKWSQTVSASAARASFTLNITSIGLSGYKFTVEAFLKLSVTSYDSSTNKTIVAVNKENNAPVSGLVKENFKVNNQTVIKVTSNYDMSQGLAFYTIYYQGANPPVVQVWDERGISVTASRP